MANIIELHNINKIYGQKVQTQVLYDINIEIEQGAFVSIIGQSGSGKSTLLNMIGSLDYPTSGKVLIDGKNTQTMNKNQLAKLRNETIGFIFQFHYLLPEFSALENVLMPYRISNRKVTHAVKERALSLLQTVELQDKVHYKINMLSGGQQQRVAIARALMNNAKLILADEPTGNLDSVSTENIYQLLRDINKKYQTTFIIITHDRKIAQKADRIIEIADGKVILDVVQ